MTAFTLYPAIDLKDGACVRLRQGDMQQATVFSQQPAEQARSFVQDGAEWLHLVDLNGAFAGQPVNSAAVRDILGAVEVPVQLGGGIRDMHTIAYWLEAGIQRVILGTVAVRNPELVRDACRQFPDRVAVGIDARDGNVAVEGWAEASTLAAEELAKRFEDAGVSAIIYTDIARDGMMEGVNREATLALAQAVQIPIIASGGVSDMEDVLALAAHGGEGIAGAIIGRALYDGTIRLMDVTARLRERSDRKLGVR